MIKLTNLGAVHLIGLPVQLEHVRDLIEFDGPLLSEFRSADGETFLYYWCDCNEATNRWLVVRTPMQRLTQYLVRASTLRDLIAGCVDKFVYVVDVGAELEPIDVWYISSLALPENYLPRPRSFYSSQGVAAEQGYQDVYISKKWNYAEVASYPKNFLQAYAFHSAFGQGGDPKTLTVDYSLTKGWIFHTLFNKLHTNAPKSKQASLEAVAFASPGYLRFSVDSELAEGLRATVVSYIEHEKQIRREIADLTAWANGHRDDMNDRHAKSLILSVCAIIGVDSVALLGHANTLNIAAKALASYVRRLRALAKNHLKGDVQLVGLVDPNDE